MNSTELPKKYRNLTSKDWSKFVKIKIPSNLSEDCGGNNYNLTCNFCSLEFVGGKTRVVGHLNGDPNKYIRTCLNPSREAKIWTANYVRKKDQKQSQHVQLEFEAERLVARKRSYSDGDDKDSNEPELLDVPSSKKEEPVIEHLQSIEKIYASLELSSSEPLAAKSFELDYQ